MKPDKPPTGSEPRDVAEEPWVRTVVARVAREIREGDAVRGAATDELLFTPLSTKGNGHDTHFLIPRLPAHQDARF